MSTKNIPVSELEVGMETPAGIVTDIVPTGDILDRVTVYIDDFQVGTVTPATRITVYL